MGIFRLASLRLEGFKSFPDRAELTFPGDITAIVGPNGAGKSNLCDAIAWVLGEQSARLLRSQTMSDVVFAGSPRRQPTGSAEVALTLVPGDGGWGEDGDRLEITRRVLRDGTSQYRLDGRRTRLKDITDRLIDAGLGTRAYAIIEQGRIGQVLSARATDRRTLFEEAAGITKYRVRRHEAELKLAETRANLMRVNDIISEVKRGLEAARRQARRAERHRRLRTEMAEVKALLLAARRLELEDVLEERRSALVAATTAQAEAASALGRAEASLEAVQREQEAQAERLTAARGEAAALDAAAQRREAEEAAARRELEDASARRDAAAADERRHSATAEGLAEGEAALAEALAAANAEAETAREAAGRAAANAEERAGAAQREAGTAEEARRALLVAVAAATEARNRCHRAEVEAEQTSYQRTRLAAEHDRTAAHLSEVAARDEAAHAAERAISETAADDDEKARQVRHRHTEAGASIVRTAAERDRATHEVFRLRHELEGVERALAGLRALPQALGRAVPEEQLLGRIADFLAPDGEVARLLDRAYGPLLALPVLASADVIPRLRGALRPGEGTLEVVLAEPGAAPRPSPLLERAGAAPEHLGWLTRALPRAAVARDLAEAERLAREDPDLMVLLPEGGRRRGARLELPGARTAVPGLLELRDRLEGMRLRADEARREEERLGAALADERKAQEALAEDLATAEAAARDAAQALAAATSAREAVHREHVRLERELEALTGELTRLDAERNALAARVIAARAEAGRMGTQAAARETEVDALLAAAERARESAAVARAEAERAQGSAAVAEERLGAARRELDHHRRELALLREQEAAARQEVELQERRGADATARAARARAELEELLARRSTAQQTVTVLSQEVEAVRSRHGDASDAAARCRQADLAARESAHEARLALSEASAALEKLDETVALTLGNAAQLPAEVPAPEEQARLAKREQELANALEALGPVNELAVAERDALAERFAFLETQRDDLERSLASLASTVKELDATCAERFLAAIEEVGATFSAVFRELFGGGEARVELSDPESPLDSGVEIRVRPPGKHTQSVLLLSGGEKALAAVALLLALFRIRPAPFCVLDEVDAPLDDANVERLCRLLREMSEETQFLLITHNRRTMAHADVLYGVTMEEPGVSRIVSVRLEA